MSVTARKERASRSHKRVEFTMGFLEDWYPAQENPVSKIIDECAVKEHIVDAVPKIHSFKPTSFVLMLHNDMILNEGNNYIIQFNTGVLEGEGIVINKEGTHITFTNPGSYRFDLCGEGTIFSEANVKLKYESNQSASNVEEFMNVKVIRHDMRLQLTCISTIFPIYNNQVISVKLISEPHESIKIFAGTRLLIHRIA